MKIRCFVKEFNTSKFIDDPAVSFEWSPTAGVSDALTFNPWIAAIHIENYVVTASDSKGCIDTTQYASKF